jgi:hypothetical protein
MGKIIVLYILIFVSHNIYYLYTEGTWVWEVLPFVHSFMLLLEFNMLASVTLLSCTSGMNVSPNALHVASYIRPVVLFFKPIYILTSNWVLCGCSSTFAMKLNSVT